MSSSTLTFQANSLLSKWGNGDGDMLSDWWWDQFDEAFPDHLDEHEVLCLLIEQHLLPVIADHGHTFEFIRIGTIHNPARLATLDGRKVDWLAPDDRLESIYVEITLESVLAITAVASESDQCAPDFGRETDQ